MSSRPRRSAAARAKEVISVHARWADTSEKEDAGTATAMSSRRTGRAGGAAASRDTASSPESTHLSVTVKLPNSKSRQAARGGNRRIDPFEGGEIVHGKRNRGGKKSYVIDSSPDDEEEEEEEEVVVEDDDDEEDDDEDEEEDDVEEEEVIRAEDDDELDEDAEGEEEMEVDADGEEDADGDIDMTPNDDTRPSAKNARTNKPRPTVKVTSSRANQDEEEDDEEEEEDDDDDELSDPADSDIGDDTIVYGDQTMADEDAEGEEIEVAGEEEEDVEEDDDMAMQQGANGDSDLDSEGGSRAETPDLAKMTKRQRARFEDIPQEFMKLPDEIQVKKVFTAEELSMRRQEMARRRRNLSEKRNEEVKMETINKLLKKQAPKINRKAAAETSEPDLQKASPVFIRWVSNKNGNRVAVPDEIMDGPAGAVFGEKSERSSGKLVTEVA
ncbi:PAPA-1-like conserved region domain-containing protein [Trichoderma gracile]